VKITITIIVTLSEAATVGPFGAAVLGRTDHRGAHCLVEHLFDHVVVLGRGLDEAVGIDFASEGFAGGRGDVVVVTQVHFGGWKSEKRENV
jgi:hypothetical protein